MASHCIPHPWCFHCDTRRIKTHNLGVTMATYMFYKRRMQPWKVGEKDQVTALQKSGERTGHRTANLFHAV